MTVRVSSSTARAFGVAGVKRAHKYGAVRVKDDGYTFDSRAEHKRYCELKLLVRGDEIADLRVHPRYPLDVNGCRVTLYEADFSYRNVLAPKVKPGDFMYGACGRLIVEDVKGLATPEYRIKRALFKILYPDAEFRELKL